jgi:hypothetical protein
MTYTVAAVAMLVLWAVGTFLFDAPGWIHILLTAGTALLIWSIVRKDEQAKG